MTIFQAFILGIVEGITEFLPVSSTGHMILVGRLLHLPQTEFLKSFEIIIQLGAILAIVFLYWKRLIMDKAVSLKVFVSFLPTAVLGLLLYKIIKKYFMGNDMIVVGTLIAGGVILIIFEKFLDEKKLKISQIKEISYPQAAAIGIFQSLAFVPGVSRSAATIVGGLLQGIKREVIVEYSFLLAVPTMFAATGLDLMKNASHIDPDQFVLLGVGFLTSFCVALATVQFLVRYVKTHNFISFGIYRIVVGVFFFLKLKGIL